MIKKRSYILFVLDIIFINFSYLLALYIRFEGNVSGNQYVEYLTRYKEHFIYITIIKLIIFLYFKLYRAVWKYASIQELINIVIASIVSNTVIAFVNRNVYHPTNQIVYHFL